MVKREKTNNNMGKRIIMAPAVMVGSLGLCLICLVYLNSSSLNNKHFTGKQVLGVQAADNTEVMKADNADISFWSQLVEENPTYRDGWIRLAVGYYEQKENDKAIEALNKAKEIDPNNETVKSLQKIIQ